MINFKLLGQSAGEGVSFVTYESGFVGSERKVAQSSLAEFGGVHEGQVGFAADLKDAAAQGIVLRDGIEAEVIDLRTLRPLDHETIVESVKKTNRLVSAEEGWGPMGVGAEVVARVIEHAFDYLDAPPLRVHQEDVPLPYAANLEVLSLPGVDKIIAAVKQVMA